jgi:hypothetical protein
VFVCVCARAREHPESFGRNGSFCFRTFAATNYKHCNALAATRSTFILLVCTHAGSSTIVCARTHYPTPYRTRFSLSFSLAHSFYAHTCACARTHTCPHHRRTNECTRACTHRRALTHTRTNTCATCTHVQTDGRRTGRLTDRWTTDRPGISCTRRTLTHWHDRLIGHSSSARAQAHADRRARSLERARTQPGCRSARRIEPQGTSRHGWLRVGRDGAYEDPRNLEMCSEYNKCRY